MKAGICFLLLTFVIAGVFGGSIYGEKEKEKADVDQKYTKVNTYKATVMAHIEKEETLDKESEEHAKGKAEEKRNDVKAEFEENTYKTTRTAIARGKPLPVIDCIARVTFEAEKVIPETYNNFLKILEKFKVDRLDGLKFASREITLIMTALEALKDETQKALDKAESGFEALKVDFVRKADTAEKQLSEIDKRITQFNIKNEYKTLIQQNSNKNKEIGESLTKKLQKCIA